MTELIELTLKVLSGEIQKLDSKIEKFNFTIIWAHLVVSSILSLRDSKGFVVNLTAINNELNKNQNFCIRRSK